MFPISRLNNRLNKRKKHRKKVIFISLFFTIFLFIFGGLLIFKKLSNVSSNVYKPTDVIKENKLDYLQENGFEKQVSFLILGLDNDESRGLENTRADALIYLTYDGLKSEINMVSIPRDTYTDIFDGKGKLINTSKINSSYGISEEASAIETVQNYLDLPVDYYITVNFLSFVKIIDSLGGIDIDVPFDINSHYSDDNSGDLLIPKGKQKLNGEQALIFSRIRKLDDDIQRGSRQQEVIKATLKKALSLNSISKYDAILKSVENNLYTNLSFKDMLNLAGGMVNNYKINSYVFDWNSEIIEGEDVVHVDESSYENIRNIFIQSLGLFPDYTLKAVE